MQFRGQFVQILTLFLICVLNTWQKGAFAQMSEISDPTEARNDPSEGPSTKTRSTPQKAQMKGYAEKEPGMKSKENRT